MALSVVHIDNPDAWTTVVTGYTFVTPVGAQVGDHIFFSWHSDFGNAADTVFPTVIPSGVSLLLPKFTYGNGTAKFWHVIHDGRASYAFTGATSGNHSRRAVWMRGIVSLGSTGVVGVRTVSTNVVTAPGVAGAARVLGFFGDRAIAAPDNITPSQGDVVAYCPAATSGSAAITSLSVVNVPAYGGSDVTATWGATVTSGNAFGFLLPYTDGEETSPVTNVAVWDGADEQPGAPSIKTAGGEAVAQSVSVSGYLSVDHMLAHDPFTIAHRGGSKNFPEMTQYAYHQSAWWGCGALELSVARTSDGVFFGLHDQNLDRTSGTTGAVPVSTMTWAQVQAYDVTAAGTTDPLQPRRPYARLEDILAEFGDTHVFFIDPKYVNSANYGELFTILLAAMPAERIVGKGFLQGSTWPDQCRARGIKTWGYGYEADVPTWPTWEAKWDFLGMDYNAPQASWDATLSYGKPVIGHICPNASAAATALAKGAVGLMCSGVQEIVPRRNPPVPPPEVGPRPIVAGTGSYGYTTGASLVLDLPDSPLEGDYLVAFISSQASVGTELTIPEGWARIGPPFVTPSSPLRTHGWYARRVGDTPEPPTVPFGISVPAQGSRHLGQIVNFRGVNPTTPINAASSVFTFNSSTTTINTVPVTATSANCLAAVMYGVTLAAPNVGTPTVPPAGWTKVCDIAQPVRDGTASSNWMFVWTKDVDAGPVGTTFTITGPAVAGNGEGTLILNGTG